MAFVGAFGGVASWRTLAPSPAPVTGRRSQAATVCMAGDAPQNRKTRGLSLAAAAAMVLLPFPSARRWKAEAASLPPAAQMLAFTPPEAVERNIEDIFGKLPKGKLSKQERKALEDAIREKIPRASDDPILHLMRQMINKKTLRDPKVTELTEADELIMELDWEDEDDAFMGRIQNGVAALVAIGGIKMVHKGGVAWEQWMKDQAKRDEEEEIEMTGQFIDPRADRIDEDEGKDNKGKKDDKGPDGSTDGDGAPDGGDVSPDTPSGYDALEKLLGDN